MAEDFSPKMPDEEVNVGCPDGCGVWLSDPNAIRKINVTVAVDLGISSLSYAFAFLRAHGCVARRLEVHPDMEFRAWQLLQELNAAPFLPLIVTEEIGRDGGWMVYGALIGGRHAG